jgi:DNA polymerase III delta subunit
MKRAYLIHGTDEAKIDHARGRLRKRAEAEGGTASLQVFDPVENRGSPDADGLVDAIASMSLMPGRRYLLADHIEKWGKRQAERVCEALAAAPPEVTVVLIARGKVPAGIAEAVSGVEGATLAFEAPSKARLPGHLVSAAATRGFELSPDAAALLVSHLGDSLSRLDNELDRLALWAGQGGTVELEDLEQMVSDNSEVRSFALGDAVVEGDRRAALKTAGRLVGQGASVAGMVYPTATAVRRAHLALSLLEAGVPPNQVERRLKAPPFVARQVIAAARSTSLDQLRDAAVALADLELWTRGGAEYPDELALDLALIAATDEAG